MRLNFLHTAARRPVSQERERRGWLDLLFPICCLGCGNPTTAPRLGLCPPCSRRLRVAAQPACRGVSRSYQRLVAGWLYEPPCDGVIKALKFRGLEYLGAELGHALAARFTELNREHDAVVAVPLHWRRRWWRGYNQAELIARAVAADLELPLLPALRRRRATRRQTSLARDARLAALRGAFGPSRRGPGAGGLRVLLVDDVFTTGATLAAAAEALIQGGASAVTGVVAARVEARGEGV